MKERTKFKLRGQGGLCDEVTFCQDLQEEKLLAILWEQHPRWRDHHGQRPEWDRAQGRPVTPGHRREGRTEERKKEEAGGWARSGGPCKIGRAHV